MAQCNDLNGQRLTAFHDAVLDERQRTQAPAAPRFTEGLWHWIEPRRTGVPDAEIARCKRSIDRQHEARSDAVETIDAWLLDELGDAADAPGARLHSETPGAMIDRLSALSLKIHHLRHEADPAGTGERRRHACQVKLQRLAGQRNDLRDCLDGLLADVADGRACFRLYPQFKIYNDPTLGTGLVE